MNNWRHHFELALGPETAWRSMSLANGLLFRMLCPSALVLIFGGLTTSFGAGAVAPTSEPRRLYLHRNWTTADGLPQNTVRTLLQSRDGYIWIGTHAGIARFDGSRFTLFTKATTRQLASDRCITMIEGTDSALWFGTEVGLVRYQAHRLDVFRAMPNGLVGDKIRHLARSGSNGVWIATSQGLSHYTSGVFKRFTIDDGLHSNDVRSVFEDSQGRVWACVDLSGSEAALQRLDPGSGKFVDLGTGRTGLLPMTHGFVEDRDGLIWRGDNNGLHHGDVEMETHFGLADGLLGGVVKWLRLGPSGALWFVTDGREEVPGRRGVQRYHNGAMQSIPLVDYGTEEDPLCVLEDSEGAAWIGTRRDGLLQLRPRTIAAYTTTAGLSSDLAHSVAPGTNGSVFVGTQLGLHEIRGGKVYSLPHKAAPEYAVVPCVSMDGWGNLWSGGHGSTIDRWIDGRSTGSGYLFGIESTGFRANVMHRGRDGWVYVGCREGVVRLGQAGSDSKIIVIPPLRGVDIRAILQDRQERLWCAVRGQGLVCVQEGSLRRYTTMDGLPSDGVLALAEGSSGNLWIGTEAGLCRFAGEQIRTLTTAHGLLDDRIHGLVLDDQNYMWLGGLSGIYRIPESEIESVADGVKMRLTPVPYGEEDGLPSSEVSSDYQPNMTVASDGTVWIATIKGVAAAEPRHLQSNHMLPGVLVEQIMLGRRIIYGDGSEAGYQKMISQESSGKKRVQIEPRGGDEIRIQFTANSFADPRKVRFRYMMEGYETAWRSGQSFDREVTYTNLRPGEYTFRLMASNNHGVWKECDTRWSFVIAPSFTQTGWFPVLLLTGGVATGLGLVAWRLEWQKAAMRAERKVAVESERSRIARELHDSLGASLTGVALQLEAARQQAMIGIPAIAALAEETRMLAHGVRELAWVTNPRCDNSESLAAFVGDYAERFARAAGLEFSIEVTGSTPRLPRPIPARVRHETIVVLKELLTNVANHAKAKHVKVSLDFENRKIRMSVMDDGQGLNITKPNGGTGIANLRERLIQLQGAIEVTSQIGSGTSVTISLPLHPTMSNRGTFPI